MSTELKLKKIMASSKIEPFIRHIRFPFLKTLQRVARLILSIQLQH